MSDVPASRPWHEDPEFWAVMEPFIFAESRWAAAKEEVDGLLNLTRPAPGAALLDLCCGVGRHSIELARRGFKVTGVDRTDLYLSQARAKAASNGLAIEFLNEDSRIFRRPEFFDGAVNLFTSLSYFEDPADERRVVENVHRSLKPGGFFVVDIMGMEVIRRRMTNKDWQEVGGAFLLERRQADPDWTRLESQWICLKGERRWDFNLRLRLYSAESLPALLRECGFHRPTLYGSLAGAPYDVAAQRLVAVARK